MRINGQPARGAEVSFQFLGDARGHTINPTGRCGDDGGFDLTTFAAHDGAPAGDYEVSITWPAWHRGLKNVGPDRLQGHLADPKKTGLRAHVEPGQTALPPFDLTAEVLPAVAGRVDDTRSNKERRNTR